MSWRLYKSQPQSLPQLSLPPLCTLSLCTCTHGPLTGSPIACMSTDNMDASDENKVVRPKLELSTLLKLAGATKDVLTFKEVMFYLGQYIIQKQLFDKKQQHIVHCAQDALGRILGVDTFSVKEPRVFFAMLSKNLVIVRSQEESTRSFAEAASGSQTQQPTQESVAGSGPSSPNIRRRRRRRTRSSRSNDAGPSHGLPGEEKDNGSDVDEDDDGSEGAKRTRSDSYSLTFDDSLSWCVIGGLASGRDRRNSQSSETPSNSARSDATAAIASDSDSDNFSVEFEVESIDSDDYNEDDDALSADDQVYELTIFEEEDDDDSFDEDTEITEADYWSCEGCKESNPPLTRNCLRCWRLRRDWLHSASLPAQPAACVDAPALDAEDGVDVPDGKTAVSSSAPESQESQEPPASRPPSSCSSSSQEKLWTCDSQPSSLANSQETVGTPELERSVSAEMRLPESCLEPCLICQSRPKNGCIVHGKTGHLMTCYVCARKLKKHNKLCPVCRLPIQAVVFTYFS
ncbi:E3 ubiquitin-protein ligase Mdm2 isoform X1 [Hippocampus comes]|uniref:MDM2 proto-oncogene n=2 Tax=Hippocampus comes TaxID=109280 RepID=A0A3Q2YMZ1_HIPCM|nr:PREDICTED: E3 ubiquitin-protein ligase Mdm2 isoform X1 [Hippocampus comes]